MRVGIFLGNVSPQWGGAFTFEKSMIDGLGELHQQTHEFFIFYSGATPRFAANPKIHLIELVNNPLFPAPFSFQAKLQSRIGKLFSFDASRGEIKKIWREIDDLHFMRNFDNSLNKALLENRIDLVWFPSMCMVPVQIPFMVTLWDLAHRHLPVFPELNVSGATWDSREKVYRAFMPKAVKVFIGTQSGKTDLSFFYNVALDNIEVAPMPAPKHLTYVTPHKETSLANIKNPFLFYPAQFWPHKNHILCLLTLKNLKENYGKNFDLVLTGSDKGNQSFIRQKAREFGLEANVHFLGFVSLEAMAWLYKNAFAMVFPTYLGPDNIPPLEAFALGCPVVASDIPGAKEQMEDAAILVDPRKEELFASAIVKLDETSRQNLIEKGYALAKRRSPQSYLMHFLKALDDIEPYRRCWSNEALWAHL